MHVWNTRTMLQHTYHAAVLCRVPCAMCCAQRGARWELSWLPLAPLAVALLCLYVSSMLEANGKEVRRGGRGEGGGVKGTLSTPRDVGVPGSAPSEADCTLLARWEPDLALPCCWAGAHAAYAAERCSLRLRPLSDLI